MTNFAEVLGVFVCGMLFGAAVAIQLLENYERLKVIEPELERQVTPAPVEDLAEPNVRLKQRSRRTPWRKVRARYEAEHRHTRQNVEERVQEMERR